MEGESGDTRGFAELSRAAEESALDGRVKDLDLVGVRFEVEDLLRELERVGRDLLCCDECRHDGLRVGIPSHTCREDTKRWVRKLGVF